VVEAVVAALGVPPLGDEPVRVGHALGIAVVEGVDDHHLRALVEPLVRERRLPSGLAGDQRHGRPQPHRLLQAALEVAKPHHALRVREISVVELLANPPLHVLVGDDHGEGAEGVRGERVAHREDPVGNLVHHPVWTV
jgi:hypothetical protein